VVDVGTGDGRAVVREAVRSPDALVIGVDASHPALIATSRRAARTAARGGVANALFVLAAAESPPCELLGVADLVTVTLPWGSLLRGVLGLDPAVVEGLAALVAPGGSLRALFSVEERDRAAVSQPVGQDLEARVRGAFAAAGMRLLEFREAPRSEIEASRSSWAARLRAGRERAAWLAVFRKDGRDPTIG
jgi:16S rRNA (adenine(1408)-N(1))-methyltransferase